MSDLGGARGVAAGRHVVRRRRKVAPSYCRTQHRVRRLSFLFLLFSGRLPVGLIKGALVYLFSVCDLVAWLFGHFAVLPWGRPKVDLPFPLFSFYRLPLREGGDARGRCSSRNTGSRAEATSYSDSVGPARQQHRTPLIPQTGGVGAAPRPARRASTRDATLAAGGLAVKQTRTIHAYPGAAAQQEHFPRTHPPPHDARTEPRWPTESLLRSHTFLHLPLPMAAGVPAASSSAKQHLAYQVQHDEERNNPRPNEHAK